MWFEFALLIVAILLIFGLTRRGFGKDELPFRLRIRHCRPGEPPTRIRLRMPGEPNPVRQRAERQFTEGRARARAAMEAPIHHQRVQANIAGQHFHNAVQNLANHGDPTVEELFTEPFLLDAIQNVMAQLNILQDQGMPVIIAVNERRNDNVGERVHAANDIANGVAGARVDTYYDLSVQHTNDMQNSHDSAINQSLRFCVQELRASSDKLVPLIVIEHYFHDNLATFCYPQTDTAAQQKWNDVVQVMRRANDGSRNVAVGVTDMEAIQLVWARAHHPKNTEKTQAILQALFDALFDCWENGVAGHRDIVCINGRTSRVLSSLVLLDFDQRMWNVQTLEETKNTIFTLVRDMVKARAMEVMDDNKTEPVTQQVAKSYLATTVEEMDQIGELDPDAEEQFRTFLETEIDALIDNYCFENPSTIPPQMIAPIRLEAKAGIA
jgi:hypothetical protein